MTYRIATFLLVVGAAAACSDTATLPGDPDAAATASDATPDDTSSADGAAGDASDIPGPLDDALADAAGDGQHGGDGGGSPTDGDPVAGATLYAALCSGCHGDAGEGGSGPILAGWSAGFDELVGDIDERMPTTNPAGCVGECALDVAAYVMTFEPVETCDEPVPGPRRLRLLTRAEYTRTVADLMGEALPNACNDDADCDVKHESCVGAQCIDDPCHVHTFVLPAPDGPLGQVHVAGTFNDWPPTLGDGGLPMEYLAGAAAYVAKTSLPDGAHQYKFVINESTWVADPANPFTADDGFGGFNSVLSIDCAANPVAGGLADIAKDFPVETRPEGFAYANHGESGVVTANHVEAYLAAARALAESDITPLLPCSWGSLDVGCVQSFVESFGRRAFRRPLTPSEVARYVSRAQSADTLAEGLRMSLTTMLSSPWFLYRFELGAEQGDGTYRLDGYEVASALSYFLWGTMPDDTLLDAAAVGALDTADGIEAEARRLLEDSRARAVLGEFALQWLGVERVLTADKSTSLFGSDSPALRQSMAEETRRLFTHVVFDSTGTYEELLTADYTFIDEELAALYGMMHAGPFAQAAAPAERAAGLLGHASVLSSYAHSDQSSPVRRGLFVREHLLCQSLGPAPPEAASVPEVDPNATTRERFEQHSASEFCSSCHQHIDPIGFGFEHFDALGAWRETEAGDAIDASGALTDVESIGSGTSTDFATLPELAALITESDRAKACFASQVFRYSSGRHEAPADACALDEITAAFEASGGQIQELLVAMVRSTPFVVRK